MDRAGPAVESKTAAIGDGDVDDAHGTRTRSDAALFDSANEP